MGSIKNNISRLTMKNQIEIYKSPDNQIELQVQFDKDTVG
jgi:hypothetical protein